MTTLRNIGLAVLCILAGVGIGSLSKPARVHAQTLTQIEFEYVSAHSSCAAVANMTVFCFASDSGEWLSLNGATTFSQIGGSPVAALTGIFVCPAGTPAGTTTGCVLATVTGGVAQLNIPSKVSAGAPPLSISGGNLVVGAPAVSVQ